MAGSAAPNGGGVGGGAGAANQTQKINFDQPLLDSINSAESSLGSKTMLNFGDISGLKRSGNLIFSSFDQEEFGEDYLDEYLNQQEKKRRLNVEQVQFLERSFEEDNKLEPERKIQLANELGLQPRQIAIWFQNRRARFKTKQVETDYETLNARYKALKTDYDSLMKENNKLKEEVLRLRHNGLGGDAKNANLQLLESKERTVVMPTKEVNARVVSEDEESNLSALAFKNEEQSSVKSRMTTNVESPRLSNGNHSPLLELGSRSHVFDGDYSDSSQNGENLQEELLHPVYVFSKNEDGNYHPLPNSFYYGFQFEDHAFNFW